MRTLVRAGAVLALFTGQAALAEPVLMISIDGLRPGDVIEAEKRGLKIPHLRQFLTEGSHAAQVRGVLPTITYPSHTTLITGVSPARHGIVGNTTFDPLQINQSGWFWYASDITAPTLWQAASAAGKTVGNVHWPVSVGAAGITWNLPQIWRTGHGDDIKLMNTLATSGLVTELEKLAGEAYAQGIDEGVDADENRARFAVRLIEAKRPDFTTVYFAALDHQEHTDGPDTPQAKAVLERIDTAVGQVIAAERKVHPDAVIFLVSDHGFEPIVRETNLFRAFIDAGLIRLDGKGQIKDWDAMPWPSGGSAAVVLARSDDAALTARVRTLLGDLKANPATGIAAIAERPEIAVMGGNPQASFYLNFAPDTQAGKWAGAAAPLTGPAVNKGTHGYFPAALHLRSTFMVMGPGVPRGKDLGEVDMRAIAPTIAKVLKVKFDSAEAAPLNF